MKVLLTAALLLASTTCLAADVIQFGSSSWGTYSEDGYVFRGSISTDGPLNDIRFLYGSHAVMTTADNSLFSLQSIDLGEYSYLFDSPEDITIMAQKANGNFITQTFRIDGVLSGGGQWDAGYETFSFSSEFTRLKAVYFENNSAAYSRGSLPENFVGGFNNRPFVMDNLVVQSVPVPAAVWLFGSALGLLGWMRRRS
jgi:hypothetical protein